MRPYKKSPRYDRDMTTEKSTSQNALDSTIAVSVIASEATIRSRPEVVRKLERKLAAGDFCTNEFAPVPQSDN